MFLLNVIVGLFSGIFSSLGLGGGAVLIFYLTTIIKTEQIKAQGFSLMFIIPVSLLCIIIYFREKIIKPKLISKMAISGAIGAFFGAIFTKIINPLILRKLFGLFFLFLSLIFFFSKNKKL